MGEHIVRIGMPYTRKQFIVYKVDEELHIIKAMTTSLYLPHMNLIRQIRYILDYGAPQYLSRHHTTLYA